MTAAIKETSAGRPLIEFTGVTKAYGRGHAAMHALAGIDFTILMVTHEADMAACAGRRIEFHDGRIDTESHIREEK